MTTVKPNRFGSKIVVFTLLISLAPALLSAQNNLRIGVHASPVVSWFGSDNNSITNQGSKAGFNFGLSFSSYFAENYAFTFGIDMMNAGGRLSGADTVNFEFSNKEGTTTESLYANNAVNYDIKSISVPLGLQLQTTQIGYVTIFTNIGIDPNVVIGGKASIPAQDIDKQTVLTELKRFNLGYHARAGIEYNIAGSTSFLVALGYENIFLDVTNDINDQPRDKITHNILSLQLGIIF